MKKYLASIIFFLTGAFFFACNFIFFFWIPRNPEIYSWILHQPRPLSDIGSGPVQLLILIILTFIALIFIVLSIYLAKKIK